MTKDELKRIEIFEETSARFTGDGYQMRDITVSTGAANAVGTLLGIVPVIPFAVIYFCRFGFEMEPFSTWMYVVAFVVTVISIVIHELIHGATWSLFAKNGFKSISFGFIVEYLTPYCSCKDPLKRSGYILGGIMPGLLLGIVPLVISCIIGNHIVFFYGAFMTVCAGGDLLIFSMIMRDRKVRDEFFLDHPTKVGLVKFEKAE